MGWTLLYIAFGAVAVWLLAEVLLQYKARLRWRLLAFGGFAAVVVGVVLLSSVVVISLGAAAFAVGQTFVTLSYRRGFTAGWALGGMPGTSRRRREVRPMPPVEADPHLEVSDLRVDAPQEPPAYRPEPLPDDTGQYGVYERDTRPGEPSQDPQDQYATAQYAGYDPAGQAPYGEQGERGGQHDGAYGYGYGGESDPYAPYAGPYADGAGASSPSSAPSYDDRYATAADDAQGAQGYAPDPSYSGSYSDGYGGYTADPYSADPYSGGQQPYGQQPPSGEVWVPQQRDAEPQPGAYGGYGTDGADGYGTGDGGYDTSSGTGYYYGEQPRY